MTRKVFKYPVRVESGTDINPIIEVPEGAHFLCLRERIVEGGNFIFDTWWAVETDNNPVDIQLYVRGTGDEVPPSVTYLGTIFPVPFVFHVFQKDLVFTDMHIMDGKFVPRSQ